MDAHGGGRWWRIGLVAGAAVLLLVVAVASRPQGASGGAPATAAAVLHPLLDIGLYLGVIIVAVGLVVIGWALWPEPGHRPQLRRRPWWHTVVASLSLAALAGLTGRLLMGHRFLALPKSLGAGQAGAPTVPPAAAAASGANGPDWLALAVMLVLVALVAGFAWWRLRRPSSHGSVRRQLARRMEETLDDTIDDVLAQADPRQAVIVAWRRLERILAGGGLPPHVAEAPTEYLARALGFLEARVDARSLERFVDLFEWARYSRNPVDEEMRDHAVATLRAVRDALSAAATRPELVPQPEPTPR
ncbi:MAG: DUF4129 domain-containing protein [Candidatus Dormiibacterota bacterium]